MRHSHTRPPASLYEALGAEHKRVLEHSAAIAVDRNTGKARRQIQREMRAAGLGRLANAVGSTSSLQKGRTRGNQAWGAVYAKGGDESLAGGALDAYSRGTVIRPVRGKWLWFQTRALARTARLPGASGRSRLTPERYRALGSPLGPLRFRRIKPDLAIYYAENLLVNPKGRARKPGKRPRTAPRKRVVLFYGIKFTRRAKRFDRDKVMKYWSSQVPVEIAVEIVRYLARRAGQ